MIFECLSTTARTSQAMKHLIPSVLKLIESSRQNYTQQLQYCAAMCLRVCCRHRAESRKTASTVYDVRLPIVMMELECSSICWGQRAYQTLGSFNFFEEMVFECINLRSAGPSVGSEGAGSQSAQISVAYFSPTIAHTHPKYGRRRSSGADALKNECEPQHDSASAPSD